MCSSTMKITQKMNLFLLNAEIRLWHIFLTFLHTVHLLSFFCSDAMHQNSKDARKRQKIEHWTRWLKTNGKTSYFADGRSMKLRILPAIRSLNLRMYLGFLLVMLWPLLSLSNAQQFDTASVNTELASASAAVIQGISTFVFHFF